MALYTGVTGKITSKKGTSTAKDIAHMSGWSVELSKEIIEVTSFGSDYKEKIPSIKDWTASCDGQADFATNSGQKDLYDAYENGDLLEFSFYLDENTFFNGEGYIESLSISHAADGSAEISISVAGSGGATLTLPDN